jgi:hypothetical protein
VGSNLARVKVFAEVIHCKAVLCNLICIVIVDLSEINIICLETQ